MIFPKSFRKESIHNRLNLNFWCHNDVDIDTPFLLDGENYAVPCIFQVWMRQDIPRIKKNISTLTPMMRFLSPHNETSLLNTSISIRRVGYYAGQASHYSDQSIQSHYFLWIDENIDRNAFIEYINNIQWKHNDTVGPRSISKMQLIPLLNNYITTG